MFPHVGEKGYMEYNAQSVPMRPYVQKPGNSTSKTLIRGGNDEMSYLQVKLPGSIYILAQLPGFHMSTLFYLQVKLPVWGSPLVGIYQGGL
jgi:hypothetical protein